MSRASTFPRLRQLAIIALIILALTALLATPRGNAQARQPLPATEEPHLELTVEPAAVAIGDLVKVRITYSNLGQPSTL